MAVYLQGSETAAGEKVLALTTGRSVHGGGGALGRSASLTTTSDPPAGQAGLDIKLSVECIDKHEEFLEE